MQTGTCIVSNLDSLFPDLPGSVNRYDHPASPIAPEYLVSWVERDNLIAPDR
jgi:hypothetical protein